MIKRKVFKTSKTLYLLVFLCLGFVVRAYLTRFGNWGDVSVFAEWGKRFWDLNLKEFYFDNNWYYSFPTYPPLSVYLLGGMYWLYDHRYFLAEVHNATKLIPASFIIYFSKPAPKDPFLYGYGYYLLIKLPSILADLGISLIIYKILKEITGKYKLALLGLVLYLFNPVSIFISSIWGQSDNLITFFGLLAFVFIYYRKIQLSILSIFISIFIKPNWIIFIPFFIFLFFIIKVNKKSIIRGILISIFAFFLITLPFSGKNIVDFSRNVLLENILPSAKGVAKASISSFNLYSLFFRIDYTPATTKLLFLPIKFLGILFYIYANLLVFREFLLRGRNINMIKILSGLFLIGSGVFFFQTGMLERYFFPVFPMLVIFMFYQKRYLLPGIFVNLLYLLNLIWSFYRRTNGFIDRLFSSNNFLLLRLCSFLILSFTVFLYIQLFLTNNEENFLKRKGL